MENKDLDSFLNDLNSEQHPEDTTNPSGDSSHALDDKTSSSLSENQQDALLREMLSGYNPSNKVEGWDKIAASLDSADEAFDHDVRNRIHQYHASYDPQSWPKFATRFTAHKQLRTRLIVLKLSEAAAILLLMLTMLHLGHEGRLPFQEKQNDPIAAHDAQTPETALRNAQSSSSNLLDAHKAVEQIQLSQTSLPKADALSGNHSTQEKIAPYSGDNPAVNFIAETDETFLSVDGLPSSLADIEEGIFVEPVVENDPVIYVASDLHAEPETLETDENARTGLESTAQFLPLAPASLTYVVKNPIQKPVLVTASGKTYFEFGMLAQADYNQLKMPEDRLNNDGEQIVFPLQGITSPGYGAGFTLALGHPRWAAETGVIYNAKTFRPGRELTIGTEADNSNVEYEAMHMQLISVPLQFRYRFDAKGRLKTYGFAGFGLHIIAQSDIDVKVAHNFPSLHEGEDPNNNPSLARTIRQAQRVSDDIRERAPFSTNSYISANLGLGVEYELLDHKSLFLQTAYQYQIPNIRFSNHNGKHVLSLSLQAGVRTPLGV